MNLSKKKLIVALMFFCATSLFAENLLFSCVQNEDAFEKSTEITIKLEDYVFSSCFELGLITGNVPIIFDDGGVQELIDSVVKLTESPSEYILLIQTKYKKDATVDSRTQEKFAQLESLSYTLFSVKNQKTVFTKNVKFSSCKTKSDLLKQLEKTNTSVMKTVAKKIN